MEEELAQRTAADNEEKLLPNVKVRRLKFHVNFSTETKAILTPGLSENKEVHPVCINEICYIGTGMFCECVVFLTKMLIEFKKKKMYTYRKKEYITIFFVGMLDA